MQFPDRGRKRGSKKLRTEAGLRNAVPRQGTETLLRESSLRSVHHLIEKCSSPTGDGNIQKHSGVAAHGKLRNAVPRQGTET